MEVFSLLDNRTFDLDEIFERQDTNIIGNIESSFRKIGHLMEKKINASWDIATHEKYIKDKIVPRRLRWDVPLNDGLTDKDSVDEWFHFFNNKGLDLLDLLIKRKQKKVRIINKTIEEIKLTLEPLKDTPEFHTLSKQLSRDIEQKDKENAARKKKKYQRDVKDFDDDLVFKWQNKPDEPGINSNASSPVKEVRLDLNPKEEKQREIPSNTNAHGNYNGYNTPNQKPRWNNNNYNWKKPFWKNNWNNGYNNNFQGRPYQQPPYNRRSPTPPWRNQEREGERNHYIDKSRRDDRTWREERPYHQDDRRGRSPHNNYYTVPVYNKFENLRRYDDGRSPAYQRYPQERQKQERSPARFLDQRRRNSPRRHHQEDRPRRPDRYTPEDNKNRKTGKEEDKKPEHQRDRHREDHSRKTPRRSMEKKNIRNEKREEDAGQESRSKRKRE